MIIPDGRFDGTRYAMRDRRLIFEGRFFGPLLAQLLDAMKLYEDTRVILPFPTMFGEPVLLHARNQLAAEEWSAELLIGGQRLEQLALQLRHLQLELRAFTIQRDLKP